MRVRLERAAWWQGRVPLEPKVSGARLYTCGFASLSCYHVPKALSLQANRNRSY